jgi:hypothetical protein
MLSQLSAIEPLNGGNYGSWRETIEIALVLWEFDLALMTDPLVEPVGPVIREGEALEAYAIRQRDFASIRMQYDLDPAKWDSCNRKCHMVIKSSIMEAIRGAIPPCETAKEYLTKVESQFTSSSKTYASVIIKRFVTEKYTFGSGVREHILKMSNMTPKLKPMDMGLKDEFIVHLVMLSLTKEFEAFEINYNSQPESWGIEKLIAMCAQEEERIKEARDDSANHVKCHKKKNYSNSPQSTKSYSHDPNASSSKAQGKAPMKEQDHVPKGICRDCKKERH